MKSFTSALLAIVFACALLAAPELAHSLGSFMAATPQTGGSGGGQGAGQLYPPKSIAYIGCSNSGDEVGAYAGVSTRGVFWPTYATGGLDVFAWSTDNANWTLFDTQRRTNNPVGGQKLFAVWVNFCDQRGLDLNNPARTPTNTMVDSIFAILKTHTTDCLSAPSKCHESVAPNIVDATHLLVYVSMINTYRPQTVCYAMNNNALGGSNQSPQDKTVGAITAGATSGTLNGTAGLGTVADATHSATFAWILDNGTEAFETVATLPGGNVVTFSPAIPAGRSVASGSTVYVGDGLGESNTRSLMQHAIGAGYAGFASVTYGPNGSGQTDAFYPTLASGDTLFYPLGPLDATLSPADTAPDGCHPSATGDPKMGTQLKNFADAQTHL